MTKERAFICGQDGTTYAFSILTALDITGHDLPQTSIVIAATNQVDMLGDALTSFQT